jgi:hypothetical protein
VISGCETTVAVTPQMNHQAVDVGCVIRAPLRYEGKADYLPRSLVAEPDSAKSVVIRYGYTTQYGFKQTAVGLTLVNPLTLFGFPTGSDSLVITGQLDVLQDDAPIRSYAAAASMKRAGTVFSEGETYTEMRLRGLLLVRDNINSQICKDESILLPLLHQPPPESSQP